MISSLGNSRRDLSDTRWTIWVIHMLLSRKSIVSTLIPATSPARKEQTKAIWTAGCRVGSSFVFSKKVDMRFPLDRFQLCVTGLPLLLGFAVMGTVGVDHIVGTSPNFISCHRGHSFHYDGQPASPPPSSHLSKDLWTRMQRLPRRMVLNPSAFSQR